MQEPDLVQRLRHGVGRERRERAPVVVERLLQVAALPVEPGHGAEHLRQLDLGPERQRRVQRQRHAVLVAPRHGPVGQVQVVVDGLVDVVGRAGQQLVVRRPGVAELAELRVGVGDPDQRLLVAPLPHRQPVLRQRLRERRVRPQPVPPGDGRLPRPAGGQGK